VPYTSSRLRAGDLRHRIELVQPYGPDQSTFGDLSLANYSPVLTTWAKIEAIQGKDVLAANQFGDQITHKITMRYRGLDQVVPIAVLDKLQVWFKGRQWQILAVLNPDERNKTLYLLCVEINQSQQQVIGTPSETLA
jgi:SPP1 family predicted phage head-tail adaptor